MVLNGLSASSQKSKFLFGLVLILFIVYRAESYKRIGKKQYRWVNIDMGRKAVAIRSTKKIVDWVSKSDTILQRNIAPRRRKKLRFRRRRTDEHPTPTLFQSLSTPLRFLVILFCKCLPPSLWWRSMNECRRRRENHIIYVSWWHLQQYLQNWVAILDKRAHISLHYRVLSSRSHYVQTVTKALNDRYTCTASELTTAPIPHTNQYATTIANLILLLQL